MFLGGGSSSISQNRLDLDTQHVRTRSTAVVEGSYCEDITVAGWPEQGCVLWKGENARSQPHPPGPSLPQIQRSEGTGPSPYPLGGGVQSRPPAGDFTGSGFVRLPTALPSSPLLPTPPFPFPPQGHPSPARLPPLCLPICLHPKMSPGPPPASLCSTSGPGGRGLWAPNCLSLTRGEVQGWFVLLPTASPLPRGEVWGWFVFLASWTQPQSTITPPDQDPYSPLQAA